MKAPKTTEEKISTVKATAKNAADLAVAIGLKAIELNRESNTPLVTEVLIQSVDSMSLDINIDVSKFMGIDILSGSELTKMAIIQTVNGFYAGEKDAELTNIISDNVSSSIASLATDLYISANEDFVPMHDGSDEDNEEKRKQEIEEGIAEIILQKVFYICSEIPASISHAVARRMGGVIGENNKELLLLHKEAVEASFNKPAKDDIWSHARLILRFIKKFEGRGHNDIAQCIDEVISHHLRHLSYELSQYLEKTNSIARKNALSMTDKLFYHTREIIGACEGRYNEGVANDLGKMISEAFFKKVGMNEDLFINIISHSMTRHIDFMCKQEDAFLTPEEGQMRSLCNSASSIIERSMDKALDILKEEVKDDCLEYMQVTESVIMNEIIDLEGKEDGFIYSRLKDVVTFINSADTGSRDPGVDSLMIVIESFMNSLDIRDRDAVERMIRLSISSQNYYLTQLFLLFQKHKDEKAACLRVIKHSAVYGVSLTTTIYQNMCETRGDAETKKEMSILNAMINNACYKVIMEATSLLEALEPEKIEVSTEQLE